MQSTEAAEPTSPKTGGSPNVTRLGVDETKRTFPPRRRLGDEQEREVTRLYVETTTPVAQIGQQFGIGESSVYRIAQRNGASLRGRTSTNVSSAASPVEDGVVPVAAPVAESAATPMPDATPARARRTRAPRQPRAKATPTPEAVSALGPDPVPAAARKPSTRGRRAAAPAQPVADSTPAAVAPVKPVGRRPGRPPGSGKAAPKPTASGGQFRFRIRFNAEKVIEAADMRAALRQLDALGATEVQAITREP